jgi:SAM-dependent methyltransferase
MTDDYDAEAYWSRVAREIAKRGENYVAGDDNPYYRYKRAKFLRRFLDAIDFRGKTVLEVGPGPGGNLRHIATHHAPARLIGADISQEMLEIARRNLAPFGSVELHKIDGTALPLADRSVDLSFTVTVLQHDTDAGMFTRIVGELCRVTRERIVLMEDVGPSRTLGGEGSWVGRHPEVYRDALAAGGFRLEEALPLNTGVSRRWFNWVFEGHKRRRAPTHKEGDPAPWGVKALIGLALPVTLVLDDVIGESENLMKMVFRRAS